MTLEQEFRFMTQSGAIPSSFHSVAVSHESCNASERPFLSSDAEAGLTIFAEFGVPSVRRDTLDEAHRNITSTFQMHLEY